METTAAMKIALPLARALLTGAIMLGFCHLQSHAQSPAPAPFTISDAELSKLSWDDIIKTAIHQGELFQQEHAIRLELQKNLDDATQRIAAIVDTATGGLTHTTTLQAGITVLADHDKKETDRANKLDKALWWYRLHWWGAWIMLGLGILACAVFAFLKFSGRIAITAAKASI
jgi:hypothetical protein